MILSLNVTGFKPSEKGPTYAEYATNFEPEFMAKAVLTDFKSGKKLFQQFYLFASNTIKPMDGTIYFEADPKYFAADQFVLFQHPEIAAAGFRSAIPLIAQDIAKALKKSQ